MSDTQEIVEKPPGARPAQAGWTSGQWVLVAIWPVLVGVLVLGYTQWKLRGVAEELAARPPVAVIDVTRYVEGGLKKNSTSQDLDALLQRSDRAAEKLQGAGYVVFRSEDLYAYPTHVEAKP